MLGALKDRIDVAAADRRVAGDDIKRAVEEALRMADELQLASVSRLLALAKVELLLSDLEGSKRRASAFLRTRKEIGASAPV
ncbi:hypothetical protein [Terrarubrum flagellatum]|uniref:hypothetical protein n=1 Tax=Terrirubrum flagellatum TaxID=2895980 RepID=UPI003145406C